MPTVYITRNIPETGPRKLREAGYEVRVWASDDVVDRDRLLQEIQDCDGVLCLLTDRVDAEFLNAAPRLQVVANMAVGFDNFDVAALTRRRVIGTNTPGVLTDTTADFAWTLLMAAARLVVPGHEYVRAGKWQTWGPLLLRGQDVHHATLGLIGLGRIGCEVARRAQGFSMHVLYYDPIRRQDLERDYGLTYTDMDRLLRESDFVSVHTPLTPETHHLISREQLRVMKKTAVLINTSRGPVVDMMALYEALRDGEIWAAGLDVTDPEPIPTDHPLLTLDNCLIVPHIASASYKTRDDMSGLAADNIIAVLSGRRPPTPVNPEVVEQKGLK